MDLRNVISVLLDDKSTRVVARSISAALKRFARKQIPKISIIHGIASRAVKLALRERYFYFSHVCYVIQGCCGARAGCLRS